MKVIKVETDNARVEIVGIKYNIKCKSCGALWGAYLKEDDTLPDGYDICFKCQSKINKNLNVKIGDVKNGNS